MNSKQRVVVSYRKHWRSLGRPVVFPWLCQFFCTTCSKWLLLCTSLSHLLDKDESVSSVWLACLACKLLIGETVCYCAYITKRGLKNASKRILFFFSQIYNVLYNALNCPQAVLHLLTQELCVVEPYSIFEMLLLLRHCSYAEKTQQFHRFPYLSACFDLLNMLFVICLILIAGLHG